VKLCNTLLFNVHTLTQYISVPTCVAFRGYVNNVQNYWFVSFCVLQDLGFTQKCSWGVRSFLLAPCRLENIYWTLKGQRCLHFRWPAVSERCLEQPVNYVCLQELIFSEIWIFMHYRSVCGLPVGFEAGRTKVWILNKYCDILEVDSWKITFACEMCWKNEPRNKHRLVFEQT
jgi:hypothetical protein